MSDRTGPVGPSATTLTEHEYEDERTASASVDEGEQYQAFARVASELMSHGISDVAGTPLHRSVDTHQLEAMAAEVVAGGGMRGLDLDAVAPMPDGAPPFSFWLAAWMHDAPTSRAELAASWYRADIDWSSAPALAFPRAVVMLFVADIADDLDASAEPLDPAVAFLPGDADPPAGISGFRGAITAGPIGDVCSTISSFFTERITALFNALRLSPSFLGGGVFTVVGGFLAGLWNTVIGLADRVVTGLVRNLSEPILRAVGHAVAVAGVVSHISTYLSGWTIEVTADPEQNRFAVGDEPDQTGVFEVGPGTGYRPWQPDLEACAELTGVRLPRLFEPGAEVRWTVQPNGGFIGDRSPMISVTERDDVVPASERPQLRYVTGREDSSDGATRYDLVAVAVRAPRAELTQVLQLARSQIDGVISSIVTGTIPVPALADSVRAALDQLLKPALDQLEQAIISGTSSVFEIHGFVDIAISYHEPDETPPATPSTPPTEPEPANTDCHLISTAEAIALTGLPLELIQVVREGDVVEGSTSPIDACGWNDGSEMAVTVTSVRNDLDGRAFADARAFWLEDEDRYTEIFVAIGDEAYTYRDTTELPFNVFAVVVARRSSHTVQALILGPGAELAFDAGPLAERLLDGR